MFQLNIFSAILQLKKKKPNYQFYRHAKKKHLQQI